MTLDPTKSFITAPKLAEMLSISTRTLSRWHRSRQGPPRVKCGNFIGYRLDAIEKWLASNETKSVNWGL